ncbi:DoxX family protein [Coralloluteibacterium stylophorae]|uniref:DoxX family protein n=1 Tax=Coralloluteibacterium stylophorae TaxID=1776034 RepID=A0A8J7VSF4_9GAMM|nr:DoxX family protein [Coralloluteibacterium stylophorae]MBS7458112.1 DoxX family protein [Coralloluteibacterium stylophorae]
MAAHPHHDLPRDASAGARPRPALAQPAGLLVLRGLAGALLLPHGLGKLLGWFGGPGLAGFAQELQGFGLLHTAPMPLLLALVQTGAGACVALGLWTRRAALLGAAFLAVTVLLNLHGGWFWMHGGIEYPLLWTGALLAVALLGPGAWSLDAWRRARHCHEIGYGLFD